MSTVNGGWIPGQRGGVIAGQRWRRRMQCNWPDFTPPASAHRRRSSGLFCHRRAQFALCQHRVRHVRVRMVRRGFRCKTFDQRISGASISHIAFFQIAQHLHEKERCDVCEKMRVEDHSLVERDTVNERFVEHRHQHDCLPTAPPKKPNRRLGPLELYGPIPSGWTFPHSVPILFSSSRWEVRRVCRVCQRA